jgi:hypothetical protein
MNAFELLLQVFEMMDMLNLWPFLIAAILLNRLLPKRRR